MCAKNYENWLAVMLAVDKVVAKISRFTFVWPTLYNGYGRYAFNHATSQL